MGKGRREQQGGAEGIPAGGVELYRALVGLADEFRMRAVAEKDYDAAAIYIALQALALQAARAGVHVHVTLARDSAGA